MVSENLTNILFFCALTLLFDSSFFCSPRNCSLPLSLSTLLNDDNSCCYERMRDELPILSWQMIISPSNPALAPSFLVDLFKRHITALINLPLDTRDKGLTYATSQT